MIYYDDEVTAEVMKTATGDYMVTTERGRKLFTNTDAVIAEVKTAVGADRGAMIVIDAEMLADLVSSFSIG